MTIQQVIDKIIAYHPPLGDREAITCDTVKFGDTSIPCTRYCNGNLSFP